MSNENPGGRGDGRDQRLQPLLGIDDSVVDRRLFDAEVERGLLAVAAVVVRRWNTGDHAVELKLGQHVQHVLSSEIAEDALFDVQADVGVPLDRGQELRLECGLPVFGEVLLCPGRLDLFKVLVYARYRPVLGQQLDRGLATNAGDAGDVVRGVSFQRLDVCHRLRAESAVSLPDRFLRRRASGFRRHD